MRQPREGVDPWKDRWYDQGPGGADPKSAFFPASTQSVTGGFLKQGLLTNDDLATQDVLDSEIKEYGFAKKARIGSETCARCHADIVEQWSKSAHRYASFDNPFFMIKRYDNCFFVRHRTRMVHVQSSKY